MLTLNSLKRSLFLLVMVLVVFSSCNKRSGKPKVLVFSKTAGFYHESIVDGVAAIQKLGAENEFDVDTTTNAEMFTEENLQQYSAVIWLSTTGDVLNHYQEADFERYIQAGGGYVGIHAAADTEYEWGWYNRLAGANFSYHPGIGDPHPNVQDGKLNVTDRNHPTTRFLPEIWNRSEMCIRDRQGATPKNLIQKSFSFSTFWKESNMPLEITKNLIIPKQKPKEFLKKTGLRRSTLW